MKKVFKSNLVGFDENAERITIFEMESPEEQEEVFCMSDNELRDALCAHDDQEYDVAPGALYHTYDIIVSGSFVILTARLAYNV